MLLDPDTSYYLDTTRIEVCAWGGRGGGCRRGGWAGGQAGKWVSGWVVWVRPGSMHRWLGRTSS